MSITPGDTGDMYSALVLRTREILVDFHYVTAYKER